MIAVEAYDWHRDLVAAEFDRYDQRVGPRIRARLDGSRCRLRRRVAQGRRVQAAVRRGDARC